MVVRSVLALSLIAAAAALLAGPAARADSLWAVTTDTCSSDGRKCVRGIVKEGAPLTSRAACEQRAQALLRTYKAAHLKVSYIRCVQL